MSSIHTRFTVVLLLVASLAGPATATLSQEGDCPHYQLSSRVIESTTSGDAVVDFENLSAEQQRIFEQTLDESDVSVSAELGHELEHKTISYNDTFYLMEMGVTECGASIRLVPMALALTFILAATITILYAVNK